MAVYSRRGILQTSLASALLAAAKNKHKPPAAGPLVIEPEWVLASRGDDIEILHGASVLIAEGRIARVSKERIRGRYSRLTLPGELLMPGLISCHTHVAGGSSTRGLFEGKRSYRLPLQLVDRLDDEALDVITAYNLAELLRSGCTTQLDMALSLHQCQSYVRVARRWGVRGYASAMIPATQRLFTIWGGGDEILADSVEGTLGEIEANARFAGEIDGVEGDLIRGQMAAHACDTHTRETMSKLIQASHEIGNGLHLHLSQGRQETDLVLRRHGMTPTAWLDELGAYQGAVFGAHMTGLDLESDPEILRHNGVTYAHCPSAGGANGFTQPYPELLAAGVNCTVAIDTHSNDMIENLKLAVIKGEARWSLTRRVSAVDLQRPTIEDSVKAATVNAARGLGRSDLGKIQEGCLADLITVDLSGPLVGVGGPPPEPLTHLLYANGLSVSNVMIQGAFKIFAGELIADDFSELSRQSGKVLENLWGELRANGFFDS